MSRVNRYLNEIRKNITMLALMDVSVSSFLTKRMSCMKYRAKYGKSICLKE